jgi:glycosyltransferase involved in cell wall biosynthesis
MLRCMRLLFLSNLFPDTTQPWRGLDNVTLLHAMRQVRPDAEIRVLCLRPGHGGWHGARCELRPRPADQVFQPSYAWVPYLPKVGGLNDRLFAWGAARALKTLPQGWQPDALLVPWLFPDACGADRLSNLAALPMVAVAQGSDVHRYLDMPLRRRAILRLARRAQIITRSEDLRARLVRAGADAARVQTVYNGVDTSTFHPGDSAAARAALNLPKDGRLLLFVGNFLPVKGIDLLLRGMALAARSLPEKLRLVLIGSGPLQASLAAEAANAGLDSEALIWAGRKAPEEVAQFMRACDVVCLSSHNEGVPNVLLEALASGRAFVTTDVGGIGEILHAAPCGGYLVPGRSPAAYAQALSQALKTPPEEHRLSTHMSSFAWEKCAERYWQALALAPKQQA